MVFLECSGTSLSFLFSFHREVEHVRGRFILNFSADSKPSDVRMEGYGSGLLGRHEVTCSSGVHLVARGLEYCRFK